jgi:diadenosine tetraphosphate (Ap4A) HIT family hydrolase
MDFHLHPQLARDTLPVTRLGDCRLLLMNDRRWTWCVLVPEVPEVRELHELAEATRARVLELACRLAKAMQQAFAGDKMNLAALGNMVPQLHLHIIVRRVDDAAWPAPVWGHGTAVPWPEAERDALLERLRELSAGLDADDPRAAVRRGSRRRPRG